MTNKLARTSRTSILIAGTVDRRAEYEDLLRRNNFVSISTCKDGISALQTMEHNPPQVLITDLRLDDMDGFELTSSIRDIEKTENRFTYVIVVTDEEIDCEYQDQASLDAIVSRSSAETRLVPQVMAGERIASLTNSLLINNHYLEERCNSLEVGQLLDPLTGLGNRRQAMRGMDDTIRQIEARGGAICLLMIKIVDIEEKLRSHSREIADELIVNVGHKIRKLVRPLDIVTYFDTGLFAVIMQHDKLTDCNEVSYRRIEEGLALQSYRTRAGFIQPDIRIGACGSGAETGPPKTACMVAASMSNLETQSRDTRLKVSVLNPFETE